MAIEMLAWPMLGPSTRSIPTAFTFLQQPCVSFVSSRLSARPAAPFPLLKVGANRGHKADLEVDNELHEYERGDDDEDNEELQRRRFRTRGREHEKDYDRDPEFADILGSCFENPQAAKAKVEERIRKKRDKILHTKTGSATPVKVTFDKFEFSNSYIWFEFFNTPLEKDISLICDTIRSWHIIGRLGGCNSLNMQLSLSPMDKRPSYDAIQGSNVTPATFYNIGDFEVQDNLARICYVGIKQIVFGGSEFENWKENVTSEDVGFSVHKI